MEEDKEQNSPWLVLIVIGLGIWAAFRFLKFLINLFSEKKHVKPRFTPNRNKNYKKPKKKKKPRIFVSHSWSHNYDYNKLIRAFKKLGFNYYNHSIPEYKALDLKTSGEIEQKINNQLLYSRCLLVLGGEYSNKYWIKKEVQIAKKLKKKIIVVKPYKINSIPDYLKNSADEIVNFNPVEIIKLII